MRCWRQLSIAKRGLTIGEWCREELLHAAADGNSAATLTRTTRPADETLLAEVLALRTILLNLFYDLANGETVSPDRMQELIAKADSEKREKASSRLQAQTIEGAA